jgi:hypothetical protein
MSFEIDPVKYGVLWEKVQGYEKQFAVIEKKMDKIEEQLEILVANANKQKGASWLAIGMLSVLSTIGGWLLHWWSK